MAGSGRTDAGAHAYGQVIAFDTECTLSTDVLQRAINACLPRSIAVSSLQEVHPEFHPRYDASGRTYRYMIWNGPERSPFWVGRAAQVYPRLDERLMQNAADILIGTHDFSSFVASVVDGSRIRTITAVHCRRDGHLLTVDIRGSGFMKQMIRTIVGTLIRAGTGCLTPEDMRRILNARDRTSAADTAPAAGLYLMSVHYDSPVDGPAAESEENR